MDKKELARIANELKPQFNIGKDGIKPGTIETIDNYLEAHKVVKIKSLQVYDKRSLSDQAEEIAKMTEANVAAIKGFTFVLYREE